MGETIYGFDKIRLNCTDSIDDLCKTIDSKFMRKNCHFFKIKEPFPMGKRLGYQSMIIMVAPNKTALEHLNQKLNDPKKYGIAEIEIVRDERETPT